MEIQESKRNCYTNPLNDNITSPKLLWKIFIEITPAENSTIPEFLILNNIKYINQFEISNIPYLLEQTPRRLLNFLRYGCGVYSRAALIVNL